MVKNSVEVLAMGAQWVQELLTAPVKRALPVLSFPAVQLMGIDVQTLIHSAARQAEGMRLVAARTKAAAAVSLMD
ncbi:MAG: hypothetical protein LBM74_02775, partial [Oscillospiraceae bacterium]|nr:hypothetical protein [Oscillospiraceae bacterium]